MEPAKGWAVAVNGIYDVRTVSPTRRGALVNWLHIHIAPVLSSASDSYIEELWRLASARHGATLHEVFVSEGL